MPRHHLPRFDETSGLDTRLASGLVPGAPKVRIVWYRDIGLRQAQTMAACPWWRSMAAPLLHTPLEQSKFDPCLFIGPDVICVVYDNDLIFWSKDVPQINQVDVELRKLGVDLEQEDDAAGFLGVTLDHDASTGLLEMEQTGLIKRIIKALGWMMSTQ
jgi:hypothetical protein